MNRFLLPVIVVIISFAPELLSYERIFQIDIEPVSPVEGDVVTTIIRIICGTNLYVWDDQQFIRDGNTLTADLKLIAPNVANTVITEYSSSNEWNDLIEGEYNVDVYLTVLRQGEIVNRDTMSTEIRIGDPASVSNASMNLPENCGVLDTFPNPFNASVVIKYTLPTTSQVSLQLCDVKGRNIKTFVKDYKQSGDHQTVLSATDIPSGLYFVKLIAGELVLTQKIMLVR
jgi:hypothetical protein